MNNELNSITNQPASSPASSSTPETYEHETDLLLKKVGQTIGADLYYDGTDALTQAGDPKKDSTAQAFSGTPLNLLANTPTLARPIPIEERKEAAISTAEIDQSARIKEREAEFQKNIMKYIEEYYQVAQQTSPSLIKTPDDRSYTDYISAVLGAMQGMKEQQIQKQLTDAKVSQETSERTKFKADERILIVDAQKEEAEKMEQMQGWMKIINDFVKWAAPALAVLSILVTALTLGAAAPLLIASAALLAYSVADSIFNITATVMEEFNKVLASMMPNNELAQAIVKVLIVAAVVVAVVALLAAGQAGVATKVGSELFQQALKFALQVATPLVMQGVVMAITASNAVPQLIGQMFEAMGIDGATNQYIQAAVMVIQLVVIAVLVVAAGVLARKLPSAKGDQLTSTVFNKLDTMVPDNIKERMAPLINAFKQVLNTSAAKEVRSMDILGKLAVTSQTLSLGIEATSSASLAVTNGFMAHYTEELGDLTAQDQFNAEIQKSMDQLSATLRTAISNSGTAAVDIHNSIISFLENLSQTMIQVSTFKG